MNTHLWLLHNQPYTRLQYQSMATTIISHIFIRPNKSYAANLCSSNNKTFKSCCASYSSSSTNGAVTAFSAPKSIRPCEHSPTITRRSGNYKPTIWDFNFIQSLNSDYSEDRYLKQASELKARLMIMLEEDTKESIQQLEFIDDLQRLGISYHFKDKIKQILTRIYEQKHLKNSHVPNQTNLYEEALEFRLLRQHGFKVSQEVFDCFKNEKGDFETSLGINDTKGLLQLYEASHMLIEGESTLELAREFATNFLKKNLDDDQFGHTVDQNVRSMMGLALELPLHWRVQRANARLFIKAYEARPDMNPLMLEFAKLDFNIVQATHQEELKHVSRWWRNTCLAEKLPFARDRLVECYFWTIGARAFEPQYGYSRIMLTKVNAFITIIDDMYDVYGTMDELRLFTDVIQRWDIETMGQLPNYMQVCFLALNNFVNEMAYDVLQDQGFLIIPYLKKSWQDLCNAYLQEARWYYQNYTPTVEEYINHGWVSISAPAILTHAFFLVANPLEKDVVTCLYKYHDIIRWSGMLLRLADDLGTSSEEMKRGDVPKLIQCYMKETNCGEKEAEEYVRFLIRETWKKMNKEVAEEVVFPHEFVRRAMDLGRMAQYMYQHGDGHGSQNSKIKYRIESLLFEPIV